MKTFVERLGRDLELPPGYVRVEADKRVGEDDLVWMEDWGPGAGSGKWLPASETVLTPTQERKCARENNIGRRAGSLFCVARKPAAGGLLEIIRSGKPPAASVIKPAAGGPADFRK